MARHPELEAKMIENPDDVDARLVYADVMQREGDPRGELIILQHRGKRDEAAAHLAKHADELLGPLRIFERTWDHDPQPAFDWHAGFIKAALVGYESNTDRREVKELGHEAVQADKAVAALLTHPSGMLLESLTVRMNMLDDGMYFDPVLQVLAEHGAPRLRTLRLGEFQQAGPGGVSNDYDYENSWAGFGDGRAVWAKLPRLEHLRLQMNFGGYSTQDITDAVGTFDLPKLKTLEVVTGGMNKDCLRSFASGKLPALTSMDLWTGSHNYGSDGGVEDLEELFAGDNVPALTHLGIVNCEFADAVIPALAKSKLLPRLKSLSLAHGMMTDEGAAALAGHADKFQHLDVLDISGNYIREALAGTHVCKRVIDDQRDWDDNYRYVALGE